MARKFVTTRELALIDSWSRELIQGTVEQEIVYWAISVQESSVHDVYDEAVQKAYMQPVRINGRVNFSQEGTRARGGTLDAQYTLEVYLHAQELAQRNVNPREGDFVEFGQIMFEVSSVTRPQLVFGQVNDKIQVKLTCVPSREGQFKADNDTFDGSDNTHPVQPRPPQTLGSKL